MNSTANYFAFLRHLLSIIVGPSTEMLLKRSLTGEALPRPAPRTGDRALALGHSPVGGAPTGSPRESSLHFSALSHRLLLMFVLDSSSEFPDVPVVEYASPPCYSWFRDRAQVSRFSQKLGSEAVSGR